MKVPPSTTGVGHFGCRSVGTLCCRATEMTLACSCKAVAESPADKSLRMRFHLVRLLVKAQYFEEAKALIECQAQ